MNSKVKKRIRKIVDDGNQEEMEELSEMLDEVIYKLDDEDVKKYENKLLKMAYGKENKMYDMREHGDEYHGGEYRESYRDDYRDDRRNYRGDYRDDYRDDYRENYRGNYRRDYDRRGGKINRRSYREDIYEEIENAMYEAKECHRKMEDLAEETDDTKIKNTLMKIAMREKEHYESLKELIEK